MEKKMYNIPSTEVTVVEALYVMASATKSVGGTEPSQGEPEEGGLAPQRYPKF